MGLFGKKKKEFDFKSVNKIDQETFFQMLNQQGWTEVDTPFEYQKDWPVKKIRKNARSYAMKEMEADLLVEVDDPSFSNNPYNHYVYYTFKKSTTPPSPNPNMNPTQPQTDLYGNNQQNLYGQNPYPATNPNDPYNQQPQDPYNQNNFDPYNQQQQQDPYNQNTSDPYNQQQFYDPNAPMTPPAPEPPSSPYQPDEEGKVLVTPTQEMFLKAHYATHEEAFYHCLDNLAKMLTMESGPIKFTDKREFLHPIMRIKDRAYYHIGQRPMNLILMKEAIHDFLLLGNEGHQVGKASGRRDDLIMIKTLGTPSFMLMNDYQLLPDEAKGQVAQTLFNLLEQFLPKFG